MHDKKHNAIQNANIKRKLQMQNVLMLSFTANMQQRATHPDNCSLSTTFVICSSVFSCVVELGERRQEGDTVGEIGSSRREGAFEGVRAKSFDAGLSTRKARVCKEGARKKERIKKGRKRRNKNRRRRKKKKKKKWKEQWKAPNIPR